MSTENLSGNKTNAAKRSGVRIASATHTRRKTSTVKTVKEAEVPVQAESATMEDKKKIHFNSTLAKESKKWTLVSVKGELAELKEVLESFSIIVSQVEIQSENLAENLNQSTYRAEKAIIIVPKSSDSSNMERWAFALGYCIHKFGKSNTIVFIDRDVKINDGSILNFYKPTAFKDQWDLIKQLGSFGFISG